MRTAPRRLLEAGFLSAALIYSALGMGFEPSGPTPVPVPWIDTADRDEVARAYQDAFSAPVPEPEWRGHDRRCAAGTSAPAFRAATLARVNYYRAMAGVPATVTEDPALSALAQEAAIMMSVEGRLTHTPEPTFACFNDDGAQAAANSNLYLGRNGPVAIDGYIEDPGDDNTDVGHRSTILHPPTRQMGVGDVELSEDGHAANALWVFDPLVFDEDAADRRPALREPDRFVAWPPRGYVPAPLVHPRWSFTLAGADLSEARVAMHAIGGPEGPGASREVPLSVVSRTGAPGHVPLPTIVWEPVLTPDPATDTDYQVVITGVAPLDSLVPSAPVREAYTYTVRVMGRRPNGQLLVAEALGRITPA